MFVCFHLGGSNRFVRKYPLRNNSCKVLILIRLTIVSSGRRLFDVRDYFSCHIFVGFLFSFL